MVGLRRITTEELMASAQHPFNGLKSEPTALSLRCSFMPLLFRCVGVLDAPDAELRIDATNEAAGVGSAAHEVLRSLPESDRLDWDAIPEAAERHSASVDEVRMLSAIGAKLWPEIASSFRGATTELYLAHEIRPGIELTGHLDLVRIDARSARCGDWKTGRKDSDYSHQLRGYAALLFRDNPDLDEVTTTAIWIREREIENYTLNRAEARAWELQLLERVTRWDGTYRPGKHCDYCPRSHACQALQAMARRDVAAFDERLAERAEAELALMAPAEIVELLHKAKSVEAYATRVQAAIKAHVVRTGEVCGAGARLSVETEEQRELDPLAAWPVLEAAGFADADFAACMKLGVSKVEKVVAKAAGRGKGAAAVRKLNEDLRKAGAVQIREVAKLTERRDPTA